MSANLLAAETSNANGTVVNVGVNDRITLNQLLAELQKILGTNLTPIYKEMRAGDVRHSQADITYTEKMIGYKPVVGLAEGLRSTVEWYKSNQ